MVLKKSQERVKTLLKDTITLLCKNGLEFKQKFNIEALIGVTLDDDEVFLISMNEIVKTDSFAEAELASLERAAAPDTTTSASHSKQKRSHNSGVDTISGLHVKVEPGSPSNYDIPQEENVQTRAEELWGGGDPPSLSPSALGDDSNFMMGDGSPPAKRQHRDSSYSDQGRSSFNMKTEDTQFEDEDSEDLVIVKEEASDSFSQSCSNIKDYQSSFSNVLQTGPSGSPAWSSPRSGAQSYNPRGYRSSSMASATVTSEGSTQDQGNVAQFTGPQQQMDKKKYVCKKGCGKIYNHQSSRKRHEDGPNHEDNKRHSCECGHKFYSHSALSYHKKTVHQGEIKQCELCTYTTIHKYAIQDHMRSQHGDGNKCEVCGSTFSTSASLRRHITSIHEREGSQCPHCDVVLSCASNMKKHLDSKHGHRKYVCDKCGKSFHWKASLCRHVRGHMPS